MLLESSLHYGSIFTCLPYYFHPYSTKYILNLSNLHASCENSFLKTFVHASDINCVKEIYMWHSTFKTFFNPQYLKTNKVMAVKILVCNSLWFHRHVANQIILQKKLQCSPFIKYFLNFRSIFEFSYVNRSTTGKNCSEVSCR